MSALDRLDKLIACWGELTPAEQVEVVASLNGADRAALENEAFAATAHLRFVPNSGPQARAYRSLADRLFYGGEGGGGKSALGVGLAFNEHRRSLLLRREAADLEGLTDIAIKFNGSRSGFSGGGRPKLVTDDGRLLQFAGNKNVGDEEGQQGVPYDYKYLDEVVQFALSQVLFHLGWIRVGTGISASQRCRCIMGSNPPIDAAGEWVIGYFRPWLDLTHPKPAKDGELRFFITDEKGDDVEVDGPTPIERDGKLYRPKSRTFIRAHLSDNPYLVNTDYASTLDALPEPLRSAIRDGNFMSARPDTPNQVIPMAWILEAQARWKPDGWKQFEMTALALDPAGGGKDAEEIIGRYGGWFTEPVSTIGPTTAEGAETAARVLKVRKHGCPMVVDSGGGYAGASITVFTQNKIAAHRFNGSAPSSAMTRDGSKLRFKNKRAEGYWRAREALNPEQEGGSIVELPPSAELRSDLAAPTYEIVAGGIQVESKDAIKERLGRSPGKGDVVMMCLAEGDIAVKRQIMGQARSAAPQFQNTGYAKLKGRR